MQTEPKNDAEQNAFGYMEELSKAYREAFSKRLTTKKADLSEEKRRCIAEMQLFLSRSAGKLALSFQAEEKKELARMLKESAEETLGAIGFTEEPDFSPDPTRGMTVPALLSRATLLANRCLNLLIRHGEGETRLFYLIISELSVLYAFAALN